MYENVTTLSSRKSISQSQITGPRPREQDSRRSREVGYVPAPRIKNAPFFDKPYEAPKSRLPHPTHCASQPTSNPSG
jgi:hypothetical protein